MNCRNSEEYMMKYFDGDGNDIESALFKQHLKSCTHCSEQFKELGEVFSFLEQTGTVEPPEGFETKVMDRIRSMEQAQKVRNEKGVSIIFNIMTALSITFLLIFVTGTADMDITQLFRELGGFLASATGKFGVAMSVVSEITGMAADVAGVILKACFTLIISYYHIFAILLAMLLAVQKMFFVLVEQAGEN